VERQPVRELGLTLSYRITVAPIKSEKGNGGTRSLVSPVTFRDILSLY
jgi:hypothetical protein